MPALSRVIASGLSAASRAPGDGPRGHDGGRRHRARCRATAARRVRGGSSSSRCQISACSRSSAAIAATSGCVSCWRSYASSSSPSSAWTRSDTAPVPSSRGRRDDEPDPHPRPRRPAARPRRARAGCVAQMSAWRRSLLGDVAEGGRPAGLPLDRGQGVVQDDRVLLELEVVEALGDVHVASLSEGGTVEAASRAALAGPHGVLHSEPEEPDDRPAPAALPHERRRDRRDAAAARAARARRDGASRARRRRGAAAEDRRPPAARRRRSATRCRPISPAGTRPADRRPRGHEVGPRRQPEQRARHPGDPRRAAAQRPGRPASRPRSSTPGRSPPSGRRRPRASRSGRGRRGSTAARRGPRSSAPGSRAGATCR